MHIFLTIDIEPPLKVSKALEVSILTKTDEVVYISASAPAFFCKGNKRGIGRIMDMIKIAIEQIPIIP